MQMWCYDATRLYQKGHDCLLLLEPCKVGLSIDAASRTAGHLLGAHSRSFTAGLKETVRHSHGRTGQQLLSICAPGTPELLRQAAGQACAAHAASQKAKASMLGYFKQQQGKNLRPVPVSSAKARAALVGMGAAVQGSKEWPTARRQKVSGQASLSQAITCDFTQKTRCPSLQGCIFKAICEPLRDAPIWIPRRKNLLFLYISPYIPKLPRHPLGQSPPSNGHHKGLL